MVETSKWGTLSFMAPEHFSGQIGMAADVFSFGVLLWQVRGGGHVAGEGRSAEGQGPCGSQHLSGLCLANGRQASALNPEPWSLSPTPPALTLA